MGPGAPFDGGPMGCAPPPPPPPKNLKTDFVQIVTLNVLFIGNEPLKSADD